jgi:replicative DNA helicase
MLGACLLTPNACHILATELQSVDFYIVKHRMIAEAILDLHAVSAPADPVTVAARLAEWGQLDGVGGLAYLIHLQADCPATSNAGHYAETIRDRAARRELLAALDETKTAVDNLAIPMDTITADLAWRMRGIDVPTHLTEPDRNIADVVADPVDYRWLIPGLLERADRMLLTGAEGLGKSTLLKQLAVQFAAGLHPWYEARFPPIRTLIVDVENSRMQVRRMLERLYRLVVEPAHQPEIGWDDPAPAFDPDNVRVRVRPQGMDLLRRGDRRWFTEAVASNHPDLVVTGPLYKLHRGKPSDEEPAAEVANYFDELRTAYDTALLIEAHSPHATDGGRRTVRPFGASLWLRWPDFGYGLRRLEDDATGPPIYEWVPWRGPRDDERAWPIRVKRGPVWPWVNAYDK